MMFIWPDGTEPVLVNNLVRMSQGKMMGSTSIKRNVGRLEHRVTRELNFCHPERSRGTSNFRER